MLLIVMAVVVAELWVVAGCVDGAEYFDGGIADMEEVVVIC